MGPATECKDTGSAGARQPRRGEGRGEGDSARWSRLCGQALPSPAQGCRRTCLAAPGCRDLGHGDRRGRLADGVSVRPAATVGSATARPPRRRGACLMAALTGLGRPYRALVELEEDWRSRQHATALGYNALALILSRTSCACGSTALK